MTNSDQHKIGELRPSQMLFSFGIGSIADLPNLSVMVMGLDNWLTTNTQVLNEERLLAAVRQEIGSQVQSLRSPPITTDSKDENFLHEAARVGVPVAPFPTWMVCPKCRLLAPLTSRLFQLKTDPYRINNTRYVHTNCPKPKKPPTVIPARFLVACEHGHLDDFPWHYFVHQGVSDCKGVLRLEEYGVTGAVTDIAVRCEGCGASRRLSDAFGSAGKENMPQCRGRHPHLRSFDEDCQQQMRALLLGASNSWFPIIQSALSIPDQSYKLAQMVRESWAVLSTATSLEALTSVLKAMQAVGQLTAFSEYSHKEIWSVIEKQKSKGEDVEDPKDLKTPEWRVFSLSVPTPKSREFQLRPVLPPIGFERYFSPTVLVEKIREVRALIGFTRIQSPGDFDDAGNVPSQYRVPISRNDPLWVPASEVNGEGIFLQFNESLLREWETKPAVRKHAQLTLEAQNRWLHSHNLDRKMVPPPTMRYMLIHSFSHALMRQLALECGYNAASWRERIYSKPPEDEKGPQAGVLIYTAAPDSEGTLGGLVNLGQPSTLGYHIAQALAAMGLCASDPLCADHQPGSGSPSLHWAACHACLFSPETSCERGNKYLDRSLLVQTFISADRHFFTDYGC